MHLVDKTGKAVAIGDVLMDFRGGTAVLRGWMLPKHEGSTGRVIVDTGAHRAEYYPSVFDLKWVK